MDCLLENAITQHIKNAVPDKPILVDFFMELLLKKNK